MVEIEFYLTITVGGIPSAYIVAAKRYLSISITVPSNSGDTSNTLIYLDIP